MPHPRARRLVAALLALHAVAVLAAAPRGAHPGATSLRVPSKTPRPPGERDDAPRRSSPARASSRDPVGDRPPVAYPGMRPFASEWERHQPLAAIDVSRLRDATRAATTSSSSSSRGASSPNATYRLEVFPADDPSPAPSSANASEPLLAVACGSFVTVRVTSSAPSEAHWVAAYAPADADVTVTAPVKYAVVAEADPSYLRTKGSRRKYRRGGLPTSGSARRGTTRGGMNMNAVSSDADVTSDADDVSGVGLVRFEVSCARASRMDFILFADDWEARQGWRTDDLIRSAVAVARSRPVAVTGSAAPRKPRVVVLGDDASATLAVVWNSGRGRRNPRMAIRRIAIAATTREGDDASSSTAGGPSADPSSSLEDFDFAAGGGGGWTSVPAATAPSFGAADLCGAPANASGFRDPGDTHLAPVDPALAPPGSAVEVRLLDDETEKDGGAFPPTDDGRGFLVRVPRSAFYASEEKSSSEEDSEPSSESVYPFGVALVGDMGRCARDDGKTWHEYGAPACDVSESIARDVERGVVSATFVFGDLSYATGYQSAWDEWLEMIAPWASRAPVLANPGNHEWDGGDWSRVRVRAGEKKKEEEEEAPPPHHGDAFGGNDSGGECGVPTRTFVPTPRPREMPREMHSFSTKGGDSSGPPVGSPGGPPPPPPPPASADPFASPFDRPGWWATTVGPFRVLSVNSEVDVGPGSRQLAWLRAELGAVNRTATPWVVFATHRPALVDSGFGADAPDVRREGGADASDVGFALAFQQPSGAYEALVDAGVDVVFGGHNHAYQRHCAFDPRTARTSAGLKKEGAEARAIPSGPTRETYGEGCVAFGRAEAWGATEPANPTTVWSTYRDPPAPVSIVAGTGGGGFTRNAVGAAFAQVTMYEFGHVRLTALNATALVGEFVDARDRGGIGANERTVLDRFAIVKTETETKRPPRR